MAVLTLLWCRRRCGTVWAMPGEWLCGAAITGGIRGSTRACSHSLTVGSKLCLPYVTRRSSQTKEIKSNASSPSALQNSNPSYHCRRAREDYPCFASTLYNKTSSSQSYLSATHSPWVSLRAASCAWCKHCSMPSASAAPALPSVCTSLP